MQKLILAILAVAGGIAAASAQKAKPPPPPAPPEPVPLYQLLPPPPTSAPVVYVYDQQPLGRAPVLIATSQAGEITANFRTNYSKLGSPRILICVNHELPEGPTTPSNAPVASLVADRQTRRDVERLIGRPLREAGATLVDQNVATQVLAGRPLDTIFASNEQAGKDREEMGKIADVVLEILVSARNVTVEGVSGEQQIYSAPDIQFTAIRLKDSKVIGQATAIDVMNRAGGPGFAVRNFSTEDITAATGLALMEDILREAK